MDDVIETVSQYIRQAFSELDIRRYAQEPAYVAALMGRLEGVAWENEDGAQVRFRATVVNDRGPNSAEHQYGADFAITLEMIGRDKTVIKKAVLGQAKKGKIEDLTKNEKSRLEKQYNKMSNYTDHLVVLETPTIIETSPMIRVIEDQISARFSERLALQTYLVNMFIACFHGDTRETFVSAVEDSSLARLNIFVKGLNPDLDPEPRPSLGGPRGPSF
ncbi:hypothetical protein [Acidithiobacillus ferrivorans]|uniref:hypothetical protein n=1 Tax=Acidithiobacillus ferrivorans TaxID=160808 RepID=UPI001C075AEB|nr:hypothetical protein [Acidithiobacillus ferrivorans]MBU2851191.1 hypothetical protein [Acidithiobacillus ferrivorans]